MVNKWNINYLLVFFIPLTLFKGFLGIDVQWFLYPLAVLFCFISLKTISLNSVFFWILVLFFLLTLNVSWDSSFLGTDLLVGLFPILALVYGAFCYQNLYNKQLVIIFLFYQSTVFIQYFIPNLFFPEINTHSWPVYGWVQQKNGYQIFNILGSLLAIFLTLKNYNGKLKYIQLSLCLFFMISLLVLGESKGAYLAFFFALCFVFFLQSYKKLNIRFRLLYLIGGGGVLMSIIFIPFIEKIIVEHVMTSLSFLSREYIYGLLFDSIKENPFLGTGSGSIKRNFPLLREASLFYVPWFLIKIHYAHSHFLQAWFEYGIFKLVLECVLLLYPLLKGNLKVIHVFSIVFLCIASNTSIATAGIPTVQFLYYAYIGWLWNYTIKDSKKVYFLSRRIKGGISFLVVIVCFITFSEIYSTIKIKQIVSRGYVEREDEKKIREALLWNAKNPIALSYLAQLYLLASMPENAMETISEIKLYSGAFIETEYLEIDLAKRFDDWDLLEKSTETLLKRYRDDNQLLFLHLFAVIKQKKCRLFRKNVPSFLEQRSKIWKNYVDKERLLDIISKQPKALQSSLFYFYAKKHRKAISEKIFFEKLENLNCIIND